MVFWRQLSSAPAAWLRENMQKMCPFGHKEATQLLAAKEQGAHDGHPKPSLWGLLSGVGSRPAPAPAAAHNCSSLPPPHAHKLASERMLAGA